MKVDKVNDVTLYPTSPFPLSQFLLVFCCFVFEFSVLVGVNVSFISYNHSSFLAHSCFCSYMGVLLPTISLTTVSSIPSSSIF